MDANKVLWLISLVIFFTSKSDGIKVNKTNAILQRFPNIFEKINGKIALNHHILNRAAQEDELCALQLNELFESFNDGEEWAMKMLDSWGKVPSGLLVGNTYDLGNFDECYDIRHTSINSNIGDIQGQYCLINVEIPFDVESVTLGLGVCTPASCSPKNVEIIATQILSLVDAVITVDEDKCRIKIPVQLDAKDKAAISILSIIFILMVISTIYDVTTKLQEKPQKPICLAFSLSCNAKKLFSVQKSKSSEVIHCLNGIRVISLLWVVLGHTYSLLLVVPQINKLYMMDWVDNAYSMLIQSGGVAVDSFLLLGGLIVTWSILKELDKTKKLNIPMMYLHRYLRLTPPYAILILLSVSLFRHVGKGPFANENWLGVDNNQFCIDYWWSAFLYVQNYVNSLEVCVDHSWYLSVDFQMFILSPLFIYPFWKYGKKWMGFIVLSILLTVACSFTTFYTLEFSLRRLGGTSTNGAEYISKVYLPTHVRAGAWLVGAAFGYILHATKNQKIKISKVYVVSGWIISLSTIILVIFGEFDIQNFRRNESLVGSAFYESCSRVSWAIAMGWIIFACARGYGGFINSFLSHAYWLPLARLSYAMYLTHAFEQFVIGKNQRVPQYFNDGMTTYQYFGDLGYTFFVSIFLTLGFETPIPYIESFIFKKDKSSQPIAKPVIQSIEEGNILAQDQPNLHQKTESELIPVASTSGLVKQESLNFDTENRHADDIARMCEKT